MSSVFRSHSRSQIEKWARGLTYFRYVAAVGGHANDGDRFLLTLGCDSENALRRIMMALGFAEDAFIARPKSSKMEQFPHLHQPGKVTINGSSAFCWHANNCFEVHVSGTAGDLYTVSDEDFDACKKIELMLDPIKDSIVDPPVGHNRCVSPKFYPEIWK